MTKPAPVDGSPAGHPFFKVGGTLDPNARCYIERPADRELVKAIRARELCLVLAPRQTGKSSLMLRAREVVSNGAASDPPIAGAVVDLQLLGSHTEIDAWFRDVLYQIERSLRLKQDTGDFWYANKSLGATQRFIKFLEDVLLAELEGEVVIFLDEIDSVPKSFSDDVFTTIRSFENARRANSELARASFVLLGVADASRLIRDTTRTAFNVGVAIEVQDFAPGDVGSFLAVLGREAEPLVQRIFHWTDGQPLLVQRLAQIAYTWPRSERTPERLDVEVNQLFITRDVDEQLQHDTHLLPIRSYLLADERAVRKTLLAYERVLRNKPVAVADDPQTAARLRLAGVVRFTGGQMTSRNLIYRSVFGPAWVHRHLVAGIEASFFRAGGPLDPDAGCYVERQADRQLLRAMLNGESVSLLGPRQIGKTSLILRAMKSLAEHRSSSGSRSATRVALVDCTTMGQQRDFNDWFRALRYQIAKSLNIAYTPSASEVVPSDSLVTVLKSFFKDVVLSELDCRVVVAFDEFQSLPSPDVQHLLHALLALDKQRHEDERLRRLSFVLMAPCDVLTPKATWQRVRLEDFGASEIEQLAVLLGEGSEALAEQIYNWTSGQPVLVQRLFQTAYSWPANQRTADHVNSAVRDLFLKPALDEVVVREAHLATIRNVLLEAPGLEQRLQLYLRILEGRNPRPSLAPEAVESLCSSGILRRSGSNLELRNRLYGEVFNKAWVSERMPKKPPKSFASLLIGGLATLVLLVGAAAIYWPSASKKASLSAALEGASNDARAAEVYEQLSGIDHALAQQLLKSYFERQADALEEKASAAIKEKDGDKAIILGMTAARKANRSLADDVLELIQPSDSADRVDYSTLEITINAAEAVGQAVFSDSSLFLFTAADSGTVSAWDLKTGVLVSSVAPFQSPPRALRVLGPTSIFLASREGGGVTREEAFSRLALVSLPLPIVKQLPIVKPKLVVVTAQPFLERVFDAVAADDRIFVASTYAYELNNPTLVDRWSARSITSAGVNSLAIFHAELATGEASGAVNLWDINTHRLLRTLPSPAEVTKVAFSQDGLWLLVATNTARTELWRRSSLDAAFERQSVGPNVAERYVSQAHFCAGDQELIGSVSFAEKQARSGVATHRRDDVAPSSQLRLRKPRIALGLSADCQHVAVASGNTIRLHRFGKPSSEAASTGATVTDEQLREWQRKLGLFVQSDATVAELKGDDAPGLPFAWSESRFQ